MSHLQIHRLLKRVVKLPAKMAMALPLQDCHSIWSLYKRQSHNTQKLEGSIKSTWHILFWHLLILKCFALLFKERSHAKYARVIQKAKHKQTIHCNKCLQQTFTDINKMEGILLHRYLPSHVEVEHCSSCTFLSTLGHHKGCDKTQPVAVGSVYMKELYSSTCSSCHMEEQLSPNDGCQHRHTIPRSLW